MKISGARTEPFAAIRKRALARAGAQVSVREAQAPDSAAFLGLSETDLTPQVQEALSTLMTEIDDLRAEVSRLKLRLNEAQFQADQDVLTPVLNPQAIAARSQLARFDDGRLTVERLDLANRIVAEFIEGRRPILAPLA